jgi:hypothetical protein
VLVILVAYMCSSVVLLACSPKSEEAAAC